MAKAAGQVDKYANIMLTAVTESAANTLTFTELPQVTTLLEKKAYLLNRIVYDLGVTLLNELKADGERVQFGLSLNSRFTTPTIIEPAIVDYNVQYCRTQTAVGYDVSTGMINKDFSTLPGYGILLPTRPLYLYAKGTSLATASTISARLYFTVLDLTPADYWDLVESLQAFS